MSISMVHAVVQVRPLPAVSSAEAGVQVLVGDLLELAVAAAPKGELAAVAHSGLRMMLPAGSAVPGDLLTVRVLSVDPRLELQIVERRPTGSATHETDAWDSSALRSDPAWIASRRGLSVGAVDATTDLVRQWRDLVLGAAASLEAAEPGGAPVSSWPLQLPFPPGPQFVLLRMLQHPQLQERESAGEHDACVVVQDGDVQLCLQLQLGGKPVELLLRWQNGVWIKLVAVDASVRARVQACLPALASVLAVVPIKLLGCQVGAWRAPQRELRPKHWNAALSGAPGAALLRVATEFVKLVLSAQPSDPTTVISR